MIIGENKPIHEKYNVVNYGVAAATHLNHFTEEEVVKLSSQLVLYQALPEDTVASLREKNDRVDHYWR